MIHIENLTPHEIRENRSRLQLCCFNVKCRLQFSISPLGDTAELTVVRPLRHACVQTSSGLFVSQKGKWRPLDVSLKRS